MFSSPLWGPEAREWEGGCLVFWLQRCDRELGPRAHLRLGRGRCTQDAPSGRAPLDAHERSISNPRPGLVFPKQPPNIHTTAPRLSTSVLSLSHNHCPEPRPTEDGCGTPLGRLRPGVRRVSSDPRAPERAGRGGWPCPPAVSGARARPGPHAGLPGSLSPGVRGHVRGGEAAAGARRLGQAGGGRARLASLVHHTHLQARTWVLVAF